MANLRREKRTLTLWSKLSLAVAERQISILLILLSKDMVSSQAGGDHTDRGWTRTGKINCLMAFLTLGEGFGIFQTVAKTQQVCAEVCETFSN